MRRNFCTEGLIGCWNGLPRETVVSLSLELFKRNLDEAPNAMAWLT